MFEAVKILVKMELGGLKPIGNFWNIVSLSTTCKILLNYLSYGRPMTNIASSFVYLNCLLENSL